MKHRIFIFLLAMSGILVACQDNGKGSGDAKSSPSAAADSSQHAFRIQDGLNVEPLLKEADSLEILYYDDPDGDSLRYSRFFTYTATRDRATVGAMLANLQAPVEILNGVKECRSEGKIYLHKGQQSLKTLYFSTRCDSCCYVYFIKSGVFYYTPLQAALQEQLLIQKKVSRKP